MSPAQCVRMSATQSHSALHMFCALRFEIMFHYKLQLSILINGLFHCLIVTALHNNRIYIIITQQMNKPNSLKCIAKATNSRTLRI